MREMTPHIGHSVHWCGQKEKTEVDLGAKLEGARCARVMFGSGRQSSYMDGRCETRHQMAKLLQNHMIDSKFIPSEPYDPYCLPHAILTGDHTAAMRLRILFTLLFVSMSVAANFDGKPNISLIPRCAMRSVAGKLAHAFDPVIGALVVCAYDKQDCYSAGGAGGAHREPSKFTRTKCDIAFTACVAVNGVSRVNHANFQACLYGSWISRTAVTYQALWRRIGMRRQSCFVRSFIRRRTFLQITRLGNGKCKISRVLCSRVSVFDNHKSQLTF
jgi:hypothetical protein